MVPHLVDRISVITINKGRHRHLARLLEGLKRGRLPDECVIVEMDETFVARGPDDWVQHVPLPDSGLPLALARNTGRRSATGDILVFLDVDCVPCSALVESMADALATHDGLICCEVFYLPADAVVDGWTQTDLARAGSPHPARIFPKIGTAQAPNPGLFWSLAFGIRASTFDRLGGFDEAFLGYGAEDTDFAFRAAAAGVPVLFSAKGRAFHQRHDSFDPPLQYIADIARNADLFRARHGFWPMRDWLNAFDRMGLISLRKGSAIEIHRCPTGAEMEAARIPPNRPF